MLQVTIPASESYDEATNTFIYTKEHTLQLEHSLVSLSKWESKWCKPFLSKEPKSVEETMDYIRCMTLTQNVDQSIYSVANFPDTTIKQIQEYINAPMTATWFSEKENSKNKKSKEVVTAEVIYYWMIALQIPFECQKWHLNRLMTLIKVCNEKNNAASGSKKMSKKAIMSQNSSINAARRKAMHSRG